MAGKKMYRVDKSLLDIATVNMQLNIARDIQDLEPGFQSNIQTLLA